MTSEQAELRDLLASNRIFRREILQELASFNN